MALGWLKKTKEHTRPKAFAGKCHVGSKSSCVPIRKMGRCCKLVRVEILQMRFAVVGLGQELLLCPRIGRGSLVLPGSFLIA